MQKRASLVGWQATAIHNWMAALKVQFRTFGPIFGAEPMRDVGREGVERRATCWRGAGGCVSDHADHGLDEQHA
jgi:hypothetical protein